MEAGPKVERSILWRLAARIIMSLLVPFTMAFVVIIIIGKQVVILLRNVTTTNTTYIRWTGHQPNWFVKPLILHT